MSDERMIVSWHPVYRLDDEVWMDGRAHEVIVRQGDDDEEWLIGIDAETGYVVLRNAGCREAWHHLGDHVGAMGDAVEQVLRAGICRDCGGDGQVERVRGGDPANVRDEECETCGGTGLAWAPAAASTRSSTRRARGATTSPRTAERQRERGRATEHVPVRNHGRGVASA